jgi:ElaB/YqjD/DUF883 family membrane-anchored ribosome-binding protein
MEESVKSEVDALRADFKQIKEDLKGLTAAISQLAAKQGAEAVDELKQKRDKVEAQLRQAAGEAKTTLEEHVREKPLNTLLLAFAVGLVLGKGLGR